MRSDFLSRLRQAVEDEQNDLAHSNMKHPKRELFDVGFQAGKYAGLQQALFFIEALTKQEDD